MEAQVLALVHPPVTYYPGGRRSWPLAWLPDSDCRTYSPWRCGFCIFDIFFNSCCPCPGLLLPLDPLEPQRVSPLGGSGRWGLYWFLVAHTVWGLACSLFLTCFIFSLLWLWLTLQVQTEEQKGGQRRAFGLGWEVGSGWQQGQAFCQPK